MSRPCLVFAGSLQAFELSRSIMGSGVTSVAAAFTPEPGRHGGAVEKPRDIDDVLRRLLSDNSRSRETSVLSTEDDAYLTSLISAVRAGRRAVVIVEDADERLRYMFSNSTRAEAVSMLGKVIEATGRRLAESED